jgi:hypothetical protein
MVRLSIPQRNRSSPWSSAEDSQEFLIFNAYTEIMGKHRWLTLKGGENNSCWNSIVKAGKKQTKTHLIKPSTSIYHRKNHMSKKICDLSRQRKNFRF